MLWKGEIIDRNELALGRWPIKAPPDKTSQVMTPSSLPYVGRLGPGLRDDSASWVKQGQEFGSLPAVKKITARFCPTASKGAYDLGVCTPKPKIIATSLPVNGWVTVIVALSDLVRMELASRFHDLPQPGFYIGTKLYACLLTETQRCSSLVINNWCSVDY